MSLVLPEHVINSIKKYLNQYFAIVNPEIIIHRASENGDSYSGDVYRIIIKSSEFNDELKPLNIKEIRLITKTPPRNRLRRQIFNSSRHFAREHYAYLSILPEFEKFQRTYLKESQIFKSYPRLVAGSSEEGKEFVILTDLSMHGFKNSDRPTPLSYNKCVAVIKSLAKFHAISFAFKEQNPKKFLKLVKPLQEIIFKEPVKSVLDDFLKKKVDYALTTLGEGDETVREKLVEFRKVFTKSMVNCVTEKQDACIIHGDCWISNILFRDSKKSPEIRFLDWQVVRYGSPAIDLSYFIFCCTNTELRQSLPNLLRIYHDELVARINLFGLAGAEIFSFEKLEIHMKKYARFGLGMALMTLHSTSCQADDMPDVVETLNGGDLRQLDEISEKLIVKPAYRKRMAGVCRDVVRFEYI